MAYQDDSAYYSNRAAKEHEHAEQAADATIAAIHNDLARRYGALAVGVVPALPKSALAIESNDPTI
jgi:hypothetical protein